jgi:hypothetical protein
MPKAVARISEPPPHFRPVWPPIRGIEVSSRSRVNLGVPSPTCYAPRPPSRGNVAVYHVIGPAAGGHKPISWRIVIICPR